jgi:hypothetical protein
LKQIAATKDITTPVIRSPKKAVSSTMIRKQNADVGGLNVDGNFIESKTKDPISTVDNNVETKRFVNI